MAAATSIRSSAPSPPTATWPENLPVATKIANEVICLPMHHALSEEDVQKVIEIIINPTILIM